MAKEGRDKLLIIDSSARNITHFPSPNKYDVTLTDDYEDVAGITLISASMPFSQHLINTNNQTFVLTMSSTEYTITIAEGSYSDSTFPAVLKSALDGAGTGKIFTVAIDANSGVLSISTNDSTDFSFTITSSSLAHVLGVLKSTAYSSTSGSFTSPYRTSFSGVNKLFVHMEHPSGDSLRSPSLGADRAFAMIEKGASDKATYVGYDVPFYKKVFNPPLARFNKMTLKFIDIDNNLYDFQNQDHTLVISLHCVNPKKYRDWSVHK